MSLVDLSCYKCHRMSKWFINNRNLILIVLEPGLLRSGFQHRWVLGRALFHVADCSLYFHMQNEEEVNSLMTLTRALIPLLRSPSSNPNYLPMVPLPNIITLGSRVSTYGLGGNIHIQYITSAQQLFQSLYQPAGWQSLQASRAWKEDRQHWGSRAVPQCVCPGYPCAWSDFAQFVP